MYTRAAASDYDDWAAVHGNPGWSSKQLLPLLRKVRHLIPYNQIYRLGYRLSPSVRDVRGRAGEAHPWVFGSVEGVLWRRIFIGREGVPGRGCPIRPR